MGQGQHSKDQRLGDSWEAGVTVGTKEILRPGNTVPPALREPEIPTEAVAVDGPVGHHKTKTSGIERRLCV